MQMDIVLEIIDLYISDGATMKLRRLASYTVLPLLVVRNHIAIHEQLAS